MLSIPSALPRFTRPWLVSLGSRRFLSGGVGENAGTPATHTYGAGSMMARILMPRLVPQSSSRDDAVLRHVDEVDASVIRGVCRSSIIRGIREWPLRAPGVSVEVFEPSTRPSLLCWK